jgi:hypothetical protein
MMSPVVPQDPTGEPTCDAPETRALAKQACFDCHSKQEARERDR